MPVRCVLIATGSRESASRDALAAGFYPALALTKSDCVRGLVEVRRRAHELGIHTVVIHSADWQHEPMPQLYELAAVRLGLPECHIIGPVGIPGLRLSRSKLRGNAAMLPLEAARGLSLSAAEVSRFILNDRRKPARCPEPARQRGEMVLALWLIAPGTTVGGTVTHISGVLGGFREAGLRVALVAMYDPPPQIQANIDEFVRVPPLGRHARATPETLAIAANRLARDAAKRVLPSLRPSFIYQRHGAFVTCGIELGQQARIPVVVEWNASEVWVRNHWHASHLVRDLFAPLLTAEEQYVTTRADVVAAVSEHAARMALAAGASKDSVIVVPNGVDLREIDRGRALASSHNDGPLVGWVGSFGVWHGAEVLVEAMSVLPERIRSVMIGDGDRRDACEELARRLGVWERIEWTGTLPHIEAIRRLAECDVLASPHVQLAGGEPFFGSPTKVFEYMAIGRPIVASALEQLADVLVDGQSARLVPPGDASAFARAIEQILDEPDRGRRLGDSARARAQNEHTWGSRARIILERLGA